MQNPTVTVLDMNKKYDSLAQAIDEIRVTIQRDLSDGPATAQAARLVALSLCKEAYSMLETADSTLRCLHDPAADGGSEKGNLLKPMDPDVEAVVEAILKKWSVQEEAVAPYMCEITALILPIIESLVQKSQEKLREADELTQQVRSLAW